MAADFSEVVLRVEGADVEVKNWSSYEYHTDFLTPTDGWSFTVGDDRAIDLVNLFPPGKRVTLSIDGYVQGDGYIDSTSVTSGRSGTKLVVSGRDRLAQACDTCVDPRTQFKTDGTLEDFLLTVFGPFGWDDLANYSVSNETDRSLMTGASQGIPYTKGGKKKGPKPTKAYTTHQTKPYPHEGVYEFAARTCKRFGLHIWLSAQGNIIHIGKPDFDQLPVYAIRNLRGNAGRNNNALTGSVERNMAEQPSIIVATGRGGGGEQDRSTMRVIMVNELLGLDELGVPWPATQAIIDRYKGATLLPFREYFTKSARIESDIARPIFLHDEESANTEQLEFYVRREMAHRQQRTLKASYTFEGHTLKGIPWCVDTTATVEDDFASLHETMWVKSVTYKKDRSSGTTTSVELIRPHTLEFDGDGTPTGGETIGGVDTSSLSPEETYRLASAAMTAAKARELAAATGATKK